MKRIYHTWDKWECYPAGFHNKKGNDLSLKKEDYEKLYAEFLRDIPLFSSSLFKVIDQWRYSCEHNLTNLTMNRIAWLGQAAICIEYNIPSCYRAGYFLLTEDEQHKANSTALLYLNTWLLNNGYKAIDLKTACAKSIAVSY